MLLAISTALILSSLGFTISNRSTQSSGEKSGMRIGRLLSNATSRPMRNRILLTALLTRLVCLGHSPEERYAGSEKTPG
jgi:hypothetical protein